MLETWSVLDDGGRVSGQEAADLIAERVENGELTTYLGSGSHRLLAVVSNGTRAMVVLLDGEGDPGGHATSPGADGSSDGYVLETGQEDMYDDADTVPLADALSIVRSVVDTGNPPADVSWSVDR